MPGGRPGRPGLVRRPTRGACTLGIVMMLMLRARPHRQVHDDYSASMDMEEGRPGRDSADTKYFSNTSPMFGWIAETRRPVFASLPLASCLHPRAVLSFSGPLLEEEKKKQQQKKQRVSVYPLYCLLLHSVYCAATSAGLDTKKDQRGIPVALDLYTSHRPQPSLLTALQQDQVPGWTSIPLDDNIRARCDSLFGH